MTLPANKKLEELFDLPSSIEDVEGNPVEDVETKTPHSLPITTATLTEIDKIEAALPAVKGLEASDDEMDSLAVKATESFDDLMNLGMQVDSRYASEIFAVASTMLGHAITAKTAKMNKKLKMIDLQMKKLKLDREGGNDDSLPTAQGHVLDRNELLAQLLKKTPGETNSSER